MVEIYRKIRLLGEGAFGKCYLVDAEKSGTKCVIKQMDISSMSVEEKNDALREAKILEALDHPNITRFREVYKTRKGRLCLVMDFAEGGDLQKQIKARAATNSYFPEDQIIDWFAQICLAVKHVHDRKILHRDIKSQNIFLTADNRAQLGDFGIAKVFSSTRGNAKSMVGTPYYLSPEIIDNRPYSFKSDIWAIGVLLYEMCTLKPPFDAQSLHFLALKIVRGNYPPPPQHYSSDLQQLIRALLNVNPDARPTVTQILQMPFIVNRIEQFLSESVRMKEFSHTVLHKQSIFDKQMQQAPPVTPQQTSAKQPEDRKEPQPAPIAETTMKREQQRKAMREDINKKRQAARQNSGEPEIEIYMSQAAMAQDFQKAMQEDQSTEPVIEQDSIPPEPESVVIEPDREDSETEEPTDTDTLAETQEPEMSLGDKAEALRTYLETKLGMDALIESYMIVKEIDENETYESYEDRLGQTLTLEQLDTYLPLIRTLIYLDNFLS